MISQSITQTIGSTEIIESLLKQISISHPSEYSITCGLNLESDEDLSNNSISINITSQKKLIALMYIIFQLLGDYFECYDAFTIDNFGE